MRLIRKLHTTLALPLAAVMLFSTFFATMAQAKMVGTDQVIAEASVSADREKVIDFINRDDVQAEMQALGVDPDEAMSRVTTLSDAEIQQIAGKIDEMPAGEGLGAVVGAIVLVFLVLLLTDILCLTNVFDFTRCAR